MRHWFLTFILLWRFTVPAHAQTACHIPVLRVVDGDTIVVRYLGKPEKVRLLHVDTPESVHPDQRRNTELGKKAAAYTRSRLEGKEICLEFGDEKRGNYGRLLAYVMLDQDNFNLELVRQGWSPYYTKYGKSQKFHQQFLDAQALARKEGRPVWAGQGKTLAASTPSSPEGPFRGNTASRVFHAPSCRWYQCKNCTRTFPSKDAAQKQGFRPCPICLP